MSSYPSRSFSIAFLALFTLLQAPDSLARAGKGSSFGSRGSQTWSAPRSTTITPNWSRPMERSMTPPPRPMDRPAVPMGAAPGMMSRAPMMNGYRPSFTARHPMLAGFAGGFLGAGLFGLLSGHGLFGGMANGWSFLGILIQILAVVFFVSLLMKLWRKPSQPGMTPGVTGSPASGYPPQQRVPVSLKSEDFTAFQSLLLQIQSAWSAQNMNALKSMTTPEMAQYFGEQLSDLASRGARNILSNVQFLQGDLSEAWREGTLTYATVAMRYSLIDVTTDNMGNVIDGSQTEPQTVTELWTFVKADGRGNWVLSAIQQAG
ncbi:TIM44-like domain-containing protein [Acetobacteraceae bacterium ESL0709]|nr:TIM44-like domain-containing protein [Acetobacteraceae bacterium ESL0697]MDF7677786.1 TIM44-like domain-containing protein [Acetobacteraceae bacterium ESL0709]